MLTSNRVRVAVALYVSATYAAATAEVFPRKDLSTFNYGVIGDSWASGVTYGVFGYTNYDDNKSGCMRINHAYGVQLRDDFPSDLGHGDLTFAACSGARLVDMVQGQKQMDHLPKDTRFVTMQAGGNDAGFYAVARDCIFHNEGKTYGGQYPAAGECLNSIKASEKFIGAWHLFSGAWKFVDDTIRDILKHPNAQTKGFKLYVLGYVHLFNDVEEWCDDASFSVNTNELVKGERVKLTKAVRAKINDLTTKMNAQIQSVVKNLKSDKVVYVDITDAFDGHRFCEKGSSISAQYFDSNVWLWNASPALLYSATGNANEKEDKESPKLEKEVTDDFNAVYMSKLAMENNVKKLSLEDLEVIINAWKFNWTETLDMEKGPSVQIPHESFGPGSALRPCHPKIDGHGAIKDMLKAHVSKDFK